MLGKWTTLSSNNLTLLAVSSQHQAAMICTLLEILVYLFMNKNSEIKRKTQIKISILSILFWAIIT